MTDANETAFSYSWALMGSTTVLAVLVVAALTTTRCFRRQQDKQTFLRKQSNPDAVAITTNDDDDTKQKKRETTAATTTTLTTATSSNNPRDGGTAEQLQPAVCDVWEERRRRGIAPASLHHKGGAATGKPFGSSYYYAHNNPSTTGGYKDGLRMEDFAMNGPRLLSKGRKAVGPWDTSENAENQRPATTETISTPIPSQPPPPRRRLTITQYMWDDDGGKKGTLIIDKLPGGLRSTDPAVAWSSVTVDRVEATLDDTQRGLRVVVYTKDWDYELHVNPLFATAVAVETIVKPKRLRIRLTKQAKGMLSSTYETWPHAHKKKT